MSNRTAPAPLAADAADLPGPAPRRASRHPVIRSWFLPEAPGPGTLSAHALLTGSGAYWTDRRDRPRVAVVRCGPHRVLRGDPRLLAPDSLPLRLRAVPGLFHEPFVVDVPGGCHPVHPLRRAL